MEIFLFSVLSVSRAKRAVNINFLFMNKTKHKFQNADFRVQITTGSTEQTVDLGFKLGLLINNSIIIALIGDLGSGKTAFVQGLAGGLEVPSDYYITSPSYTLINEYPGKLNLFHVDLYRIEDNVEIELEETGFYEIIAGSGVTAIEWADRLYEDIYEKHIRILFEILNPGFRKITLTSHGIYETDILKQFGNCKPF